MANTFASLSDRMNHIFSKLRNKGRLTELEIKQAMREIRVALLEADVNFQVVKQFVATVSEKALGEDILKSLTPEQQIIKIVNGFIPVWLQYRDTLILVKIAKEEQ